VKGCFTDRYLAQRLYKSSLITPWLSQVERVVLNALAKVCGVAAGYLRLRRAKWHRLEDNPIHLVFRFGQRSPSKSRGRQNTSAHFAEADAVTVALAPAGDR